MPKKLLFVDTNIWLDFYRARSEAGLSLLQHLDSIRTQIIMTYVVEMEFKRNRQCVILESMKELKAPDHIPRPGLFSDAKAVRALQKNLKDAERRVAALKKRLKQILKQPSMYDPVYQVTQRCFHRNDDITLVRDSDEKGMIRRKAFRRFLLGCPPRKRGDTSIGDAVNWEWIVNCATTKGSEVHIVSRDSDYGVVFEDAAFLNDHLAQEFRERVSRKRRIQLHSRLSEALKFFAVPVTPQEEKEERALIAASVEDPTAHFTEADWAEFMSFVDNFERNEKDKKANQALQTTPMTRSEG